MRRQSTLQGLLERDGLLAAVTLGVVVLLSWAYLLMGAGMEMPDMGTVVGHAPAAWSAGRTLATAVMWAVMMTAMMLPSAAPMILLYGTIAHRRKAGGQPTVNTGVLAVGYLLAWTGFGLAATGLQWALDQWGLLSATMAAEAASFAVALLLTAGVYQLSPLKYACLRQCRSPLAFLARHWRNDLAGTLRLGIRHGLYCVGCCWALMALLFVGGVMNLLWIIGLTLLVLLEKLAPRERLVARMSGAALIGAAAALLIT